MAQLEQVLAATAQLPGQLRRRRALGDAADHEDQGRGAALGALQGGAGPGVEDPAAGAAVVAHRVAVGAVDGQAAAAAGGAAQAARVQGVHQVVVAGLFVEQVAQGEVHGRASQAATGRCCSTPPPSRGKLSPPTWDHEPPWFVELPASPTNGLAKDSGADAFQTKSVSLTRFVRLLGLADPVQVDAVAAAIGLCVGVP